MKFSTNLMSLKKQAGVTLIEMITSLAILALVIGGALALYNSASTSQSTTQFNSDLSAIRSAVRSTYYGQGGYGAATNLNSVLITGKRVPSTMAVAGTTVTHSLGGTMAVTGNGPNFDVDLTNIPTAVCLNLLTGATGWTKVLVTGGTARTVFPITPVLAATDCSAAPFVSIKFTGF